MKIFRVHLDVTLKLQSGVKKIPMSYCVFAKNEQQAKNIARHISLTGIDVGKCKEECPGLVLPENVVEKLPEEVLESINKY